MDSTRGNDANDGTTLSTAFKTIGASLPKVVPGDTVLVRKGIYREVLNIGVSGTPAKPITFGAYGDGEVIIDGSTAFAGWTQYAGSVWKVQVPASVKAQLGMSPSGHSVTIDAVVANGVPLVTYSTTQGPPASGSGQWYFDMASTLYADMGSVDPTSPSADILVVVCNHGGSTIFVGGSYLNIIGFTIRGSGWSGLWTYDFSNSTDNNNITTTTGNHNITIAYSDIKFNDGPGIALEGGSNNALLYSRVYHNVLNNWPYGANGNAPSGGNWPEAVNFSNEASPTARGNIVALNGGEGIGSGGKGTANGVTIGNILLEQNVVYDNWSVNIYPCNQDPVGVIRNNFVFDHTTNPAIMFYPKNAATGDGPNAGEYYMEKFRTCITLGDEATAIEAGAQVYNNVIMGCRYGIQDYYEHSVAHGLKNDLIVNNTIVMDPSPYSAENIAGIRIGDGPANSNSIIANNIVYRPVTCGASQSCPLISAVGAAPLAGVTLQNNVYFSYGTAATDHSLFYTGTQTEGFATWQSSQNGQDASSKYQDPLLIGEPNNIQAVGGAVFDYNQASLSSSSPAKGQGLPQTSVFTTDFLGTMRGASWSVGAIQ